MEQRRVFLGLREMVLRFDLEIDVDFPFPVRVQVGCYREKLLELSLSFREITHFFELAVSIARFENECMIRFEHLGEEFLCFRRDIEHSAAATTSNAVDNEFRPDLSRNATRRFDLNIHRFRVSILSLLRPSWVSAVQLADNCRRENHHGAWYKNLLKLR